MKLVSDTLKENLKKPTTQRKGRILVEDKYYDVYNVEYYQDVYSEGNVIGNAIASQLDFDLPYMPKFDTFKYFDGVWNGNEYEYVDMGTFHTFDEKDEDEFNKHITAFDNLIKFNATFVSDGIYPKTLYEELESICEQAGVELATQNIANGSFQIEDNQFVSEESLKTVLKNICGISGTYAVIKEDKLHLQLKVETSEIINKNEHTPVTWKRKTYGINQVILGMADVNGEYVLRQDDDDIAKNGVHKLVINDNFFAYTQDKREQLIDSLFNQVKGFGYVPFEMNNEWLSYLDVGDTINLDGVDTIVLRINGKSPNGIKSTMSAPSIIDAAVDYINNTNDIENRVKRTEISVDKQNQVITSLIEDFEEIKTGVVTSKTIEGNPIHIEDAGAYDLEKLYLEGNSYQETTSGKNLFNKNDTSKMLIDHYFYAKDTIKTGSGLKMAYIPCKPNTTYTVSKIVSARFIIGYTNEVPAQGVLVVGGTQNNTEKALTTTTSSDAKYLCVFYKHSSDTLTAEEIEDTIQIEENYKMTEYEPYTNGPSPNPDYPQEIEVIEGSVDVEVVGKNLFDKDNANVLTSNVSSNAIISNNYNKILYIPCKPNTTYTISKVSSLYLNVGFTETEPSIGTSVINYTGFGTSTSATMTSDSTSKYLIVRFWNVNDTLTEQEILDSVQIEEGSTTTEYEPYKSTTVSLDLQDNFIAKIGNVKDEIDVVTGKLNKRIGKLVLNGSESWIKATNYYYWRVTDKFPLVSGGSTIPNLINTHFVPRGFDYLYGALVDYGIAFHYSLSQLAIRHKDINTLEDFKNWLSQNNVEVYYELPEPYEVQIDQTRIPLFEGINNVKVTTNLDPSYIATTYLTNAKTNAQYATRSQLQLTENSIQSVVKDTTTLNANLTDLQAVVGTETTNLKNALGDLSNNLEENYATNNSVLTIENSVSNIQTSLNQQIEITKDIQVNGVSKVKTTTGFTFDENGMTITKTNADTKTTIDEDGMVVYSTTGAENTEILVADAQGVKAENVEVRTYLVVGQNSRFQDYETGTGCFWVGE